MVKRREKKDKAVLIPAEVLADLDCAVFTDQSTGDLFRLRVKLPDLNDFMLTEDLDPLAAFFEKHYRITAEQAMKAAKYLATLPNKRTAIERRQRAQAKHENGNAYASWSPSRDHFGGFFA